MCEPETVSRLATLVLSGRVSLKGLENTYGFRNAGLANPPDSVPTKVDSSNWLQRVWKHKLWRNVFQKMKQCVGFGEISLLESTNWIAVGVCIFGFPCCFQFELLVFFWYGSAKQPQDPFPNSTQNENPKPKTKSKIQNKNQPGQRLLAWRCSECGAKECWFVPGH